MAENFGLSKRLQPNLPSKTPAKVPDELPAVKDRIACDADHNCERGTCEIIVVVGNIAKPLYLCNHHYQAHMVHIFMHGYEVKAL